MLYTPQLLTQEEFERLALLREREAEKPSRKRKREDGSTQYREEVTDTVDEADIIGYVRPAPSLS